MTSTETEVRELHQFVGGEWTPAAGAVGGSAVVDEFTELRWVTVTSGSHPLPF